MELNLQKQTELIKEWMDEKKAENIRIYDVQEKNDYTDCIIVCEGSGELHNKAIADNIQTHAKANGMYIMGSEGYSGGTWILIDLVDIVVHIFDPETRNYYDIEKLWHASKKMREQNQNNQDMSEGGEDA